MLERMYSNRDWQHVPRTITVNYWHIALASSIRGQIFSKKVLNHKETLQNMIIKSNIIYLERSVCSRTDRNPNRSRVLQFHGLIP